MNNFKSTPHRYLKRICTILLISILILMVYRNCFFFYSIRNIETDLPNVTCGYLVRSQFSARLGNELFTYASFYGIVKKYKNSTKSPFLWSKIGITEEYKIFQNLSIPQKILSEGWIDRKGFKWLREWHCCIYDDRGLSDLKCDGKNIMIYGYRQSYKYFQDSMEDIRKEFTFKSTIRDKSEKILNENLRLKNLNRNETVLIGVHLRRGDFAAKRNNDAGFWPAQMDYFQRAVTFYEKYFLENSTGPINRSQLVFFIFGNDYEWNLNATKEIGSIQPNNSHLIVIDTRESYSSVDLCTMTLCDHVIMSTGTFGWWAAFLAAGMVTYQKEYARAGSGLDKHYRKEDFYLPNWIGL